MNYWKALFVIGLLFSSLHLSAKTKKVSAQGALAKATFAGGCFWCMEPPFEKLDGVQSVVSGYMGGHQKNPSYSDVSSGKSGHLEVVQVLYDPKKISYNDLLQVFWRSVDPTDAGGQFVDRGSQYATAIFFHDVMQKKNAQVSIAEMDKTKRFKKKIVTPVIDAKKFYEAEGYHQDYYKKSTLKYKYYRYRSGRDQFIDKTWGKERNYKPKKKGEVVGTYSKPSEDEIKKRLDPLQYKVTQKEGTEPPFKNKYWDNKEKGIYVDIVSGEPLFSSEDKYKSGTGWPSFTKPLVEDHIVTRVDKKLFSTRTEIRSKHGDSHLGHVFNDGPAPTGQRYCMNSASLRFIPVADLEKLGYGKFKKLFNDEK